MASPESPRSLGHTPPCPPGGGVELEKSSVAVQQGAASPVLRPGRGKRTMTRRNIKWVPLAERDPQNPARQAGPTGRRGTKRGNQNGTRLFSLAPLAPAGYTARLFRHQPMPMARLPSSDQAMRGANGAAASIDTAIYAQRDRKLEAAREQRQAWRHAARLGLVPGGPRNFAPGLGNRENAKGRKREIMRGPAPRSTRCARFAFSLLRVFAIPFRAFTPQTDLRMAKNPLDLRPQIVYTCICPPAPAPPIRHGSPSARQCG